MEKNEILLRMNDEDVPILLIAAFRYALGRRSYMPSAVADIILKNKDKLSEWQRKQLSREVYEFEEMWGNLGDECDAATWHRFASEVVS